MAWCKASSLTAAVARTLRDAGFPATKARILTVAGDKVVEGWDVSQFLRSSLSRRTYGSLRDVMADLESWLEIQG